MAPGHKLYSCPASSTMKVTVRIDQTGVLVTHVLHHTGTFQLWLNLLASLSGWCTGQICVSVVSALIDFNFSQNTYICTVLVKIYVLLANWMPLSLISRQIKGWKILYKRYFTSYCCIDKSLRQHSVAVPTGSRFPRIQRGCVSAAYVRCHGRCLCRT